MPRDKNAPAVDQSPEVLLFSESNMRFLSEVEPQRADAFEAIMDGLPHAEIGEVTDAARLEIHADTVPVISADLATLKEAWQRPLRW